MLNGFHRARQEIKNDKALHAASIGNNRHQIIRAGFRLRCIIGGNRTAHDDAAIKIDVVERCFKDGAAYIVEKYIPFIGAVMCDLGGYVFRFVINDRIKTGFFRQPAAFFFSAGNADHVAALQFGNLSDNRSGRTGRAGNQNRFTGFRHANIHQAEIGRHTSNAQNGKHHFRRHARRYFIHAGRAFARCNDRIVLPAAGGLHQFACGKIGMIGGDDLRYAACAHRFANLNRRQIAGSVNHPVALCRVKRQHQVFDQNFVVTDLRHLGFGIGEILWANHAIGAGR